ncbi:MAG: TolC family protein [Candidatus Omnitrophica bacterium]|nr:TolC family protein [Candidatus Omnitrophota bacterium]
MRYAGRVLGFFIVCVFMHVSDASALTLAEAVARVTAQGHDIRIADKAIDAANAAAGMAHAPLLPQINAMAGQNYYAYQPAAVSGGQKLNTSEKSFASLGVDVYQTLFDFGATRVKLQAAKILADRTLDEAGSIRNQSVLSVIMAYIDVLEARRLMDVAAHELTTLAGHMREVAILYREGAATRSDLLSVRVRFNGARQKVIVARSQEKVSLAKLKETLSWQDGKPLVVEPVPALAQEGVTLSAAIRTAIDLRPELRGLDKAVLAADFDEKSLRAGDKPSLFASGGYSYADNRYQARNDNWHATVGVKLSVFNGGLTRASAAKARADKDQFIEQRRQLEERIRFEVEKAYWEMINAFQRRVLNSTAVAEAQENARVALVRYHEGAGTSVEFLDALVMRTSAEGDLWRGAHEYQRSQARFLYTMGKDLVKAYGQEARHEEH